MHSDITKYGLDYFKGIFHTYAIQNDPGVNVSYCFDINDFPVENTIKTSFKNHFKEFQEIDIEFVKFTIEDFERLLNGWLYCEFSPKSKAYIPTIETTKCIVKTLVDCFKISAFYKITSIKCKGKSVENEFGYAMDFVILTSTTKRYFCEFTVG